jgi:hypothetical protein
MNTSELEKRLLKKKYADVQQALSAEPDAALILLLESRNRKVGDCAADVLKLRGKTDVIGDALSEGKIKTVIGKIRALSILHCFGTRRPQSKDVFLKFLEDKNKNVVADALFGIVFFHDKAVLPMLYDQMKRLGPESPKFRLLARAAEALEKDNPFLYAPGFRDAGDVWCLDKSKFRERIG